MMRSLSIAATGMNAQQTNVDVISNNLANLATTGFKRQRAEFQDLVYQTLYRAGVNSADNGNILPTGLQLGLGVRTAAVYRTGDQGVVVNTNNPLDLAIQGKGFFQIDLPDGTVGYTRAGSLQIDNTGQIVTADGFVVQPGITVPANAEDITINQSGQVLIKIPGQTDAQLAGQLQLATFVNEAGMDALGNNLFAESAASGAPVVGNPGTDERGTILQGFLEQSNVNAVQEVTNLITAQRAYELNSKVITTTDQMLQTVSNLA